VGRQIQAASGSVGNMMSRFAQRAGKPALAGGVAAAGIAGVVAAGKGLRPKRHKVLGVVVPRPKLGLRAPSVGFDLGSLSKRLPTASQLSIDSVADGVTKTGQQVGRTGKRLNKVATEIQKAGETTERVGKLLSR
jgi:hypothetical protein